MFCMLCRNKNIVLYYTNIINWMYYFRLALENIFNALKNDGLCCFQYPISHPIFSAYKYLKDNSKWSNMMKSVDIAYIPVDNEILDPITDLSTMLQKIGFVDVVVAKCEKSFVYNSLKEFEGYIFLKSLIF